MTGPPARRSCDEIPAAGGKAVPNGDSVADPAGAERMVKTAVENFGRIDGVINNAGILRDRIFHRMSHMDWKMVIDVHLNGAFNVSRAAANYFKEQKSGCLRALHLDLGPGRQLRPGELLGGQDGHRRPVALDRARHGGVQRPLQLHLAVRLDAHDRHHPADTEETARRVKRLQEMGPEKVAPLAVYLASDLSKKVTGQIFASRMNEIYLFNQNRPIRSAHRSEGWTPETISEHAIPAMESNFFPLNSYQRHHRLGSHLIRQVSQRY